MEGRAFGSSLVSIRPRKRMSVWYPLQRSTMLLRPKKGTDTFPIFVARHSKFGFAAATCRESQVPTRKAVFFFFGIDMLGLQSSGLEVRQLQRQWTGRGGCSRGAETVSSSQDRGRNEGGSENHRRSHSAQLTATIRRSGEFQEKNWSRWQTGRSTKHRAEVAKTSCTIWGERVVPERVGQE